MNVTLLVPAPRRASRVGLVDALTAHYGSMGRLADYRRQLEKTTRTAGEDPSIFTIALETLAVKAFGDMGQTAWLHLIRDRFIAGHSSCELRRHLDSVPPGSVVMFDPRTPGGATRITVLRKGVAAWTRDPSVSTDVGPQSVPARVSVVLVEGPGDRSARRLASVPVDEDEQMLAGAACPAGVAECMNGVMLPMMAGTMLPSDVAEQVADGAASMADAGILFPADSAETLSPPDPAGILFPAVPAGIPFPAALVGTSSLFDQVGILFPAVPAGIPFPAGPVGTLSDQAGMLFPAVPAGILFPAGTDQDGTLSPTDPAGMLFPADYAGILFPAIPTEIPFPVGPDQDGTLSPTDPAGILFPAVLAEFPISMDPVAAMLPPDPAKFDIGGVVDMAVVGEVLLAVPDVFNSLDVVAMVGVDAVQTVEGIPMDYGDDCDNPDPRNNFETVDGMPVYYGGDFSDSDCEDPRDLAYEDWVDWYNSNAPEGCCVSFPDDGEGRLPNTKCAPVTMVVEVAQSARLRQDSLDASVTVMDIGIMVRIG